MTRKQRAAGKTNLATPKPGAFSKLAGHLPGAKRKIIAWTASLALLAGAETAALKHYWGKTAPRDEATIGLSRHLDQADAGRYDQAIRTAKALGEPFHAIGDESAGASELEAEFHAGHRLFQKRKSTLRNLLSQGMAREEAIDAIVKVTKKVHRTDGYPEFRGGLTRIELKHGLPSVPIEQYTKSEADNMKKMGEKADALMDSALNEPDLEKQKDAVLECNRLRAKAMHFRNARIIETLPKSIKLLRKNVPELSKVRSLRILCTLGASHQSRVFYHEGKTFSATPALLAEGFYSSPKPICLKLTADPEAKLSERELQCLVLGENSTTHGIISRAPRHQRDEVLSRIYRMPEGKFQELNEKTRGMRPLKRAEYIWNAFAGN